MPPIEEEAVYLIAYLFEFGPASGNGMGIVPVSGMELAAWQQNTGVELQPWEARALLRLSREYVAQVQLAEKDGCVAPWEGDDPSAQMVARSLRDTLKGLAKL
jgi:hypothetical protein